MQHEILDEIEVTRKEFGITKGLFIMVLAAFIIIMAEHFYTVFTMLDILQRTDFSASIFVELIVLFAGLYYIRFRANIYRALELNRIAIITNLLLWCFAITNIIQRVLFEFIDTSYSTLTYVAQMIGYLSIILLIAESVMVLKVPQKEVSLKFKYMRQVVLANLIVMIVVLAIYASYMFGFNIYETTIIGEYQAYKVIPVFYMFINSIPDILQLRAAYKFINEEDADESASLEE